MLQSRPKSRYVIDWIRNRKGLVLPYVLAYSFVVSVGATGIAFYAGSSARQVQSQMNHTRAFYIAEAATERALADIKMFYATNGRSPTQVELDVIRNRGFNPGTDFQVDQLAITLVGAPQTQVLTTGNYAGLNGTTQSIQIRADVTPVLGVGGVQLAQASVTQTIESQLIPIFQFGVFYENDLEILPGPSMNFVGPVHSNADIYVGSHNTTTFDSGITTAGDLFHGRKDNPSSTMNGNILIQDNNDVDQNMKNADGTWLDSSDPNWTAEATNRWGGEVKTQDHGVTSLSMPLPTGAEAHDLIERGDPSDTQEMIDQKMYYKAQIRIIDGVVQDQAGNPLNLGFADPDSGSTVNPITTSTYYNHREGEVVHSIDIDVAKLNQSQVFIDLANGSPEGLIIYHSDNTHFYSTTDHDAIRLKNGSEVIQGGMSVVSENSLYIQGDYNTVNKQPTSVMSDGFNILSNNWNDSNSYSTDLDDRRATNTTVQTAVISGNENTTVGNYNGGFENIHRFHEKWSGKTLTYSGSVAVLYESEYATGDWNYGSPQYTAPGRNWSFDTDFLDPNYSVPGFPSVYNITKSDWEQN